MVVGDSEHCGTALATQNQVSTVITVNPHISVVSNDTFLSSILFMLQTGFATTHQGSSIAAHHLYCFMYHSGVAAQHWKTIESCRWCTDHISRCARLLCLHRMEKQTGHIWPNIEGVRTFLSADVQHGVCRCNRESGVECAALIADDGHNYHQMFYIF